MMGESAGRGPLHPADSLVREPDGRPAPAFPYYGSVMVLLVPIVTAPFRAKARPINVTLLFSVMVVSARMLPCHVAGPPPSVAELPTWKTHSGLGTIDEDDTSRCGDRAAGLENKDGVRVLRHPVSGHLCED